jgi:hypothetical protein
MVVLFGGDALVLPEGLVLLLAPYAAVDLLLAPYVALDLPLGPLNELVAAMNRSAEESWLVGLSLRTLVRFDGDAISASSSVRRVRFGLADLCAEEESLCFFLRLPSACLGGSGSVEPNVVVSMSAGGGELHSDSSSLLLSGGASIASGSRTLTLRFRPSIDDRSCSIRCPRFIPTTLGWDNVVTLIEFPWQVVYNAGT